MTTDAALRRHSVLAAADGLGFASLRRESSPRSERVLLGKRLRTVTRWSQEVDPLTQGADLISAFEHLRGLGVDLRLIVFGFERNPRYPQAEAVPVTVLANPEVEPLSDESSSSLPNACVIAV